MFVLDIDGEAGRSSLAGLEREHGPLPITLTTITGRENGGEQRFFQYPAGREVRNSAGKLGAGLDIRGDGGYVIVPPSTHASGRVYRFEDEAIPVAEAPEWLLNPPSGNNTKPTSGALHPA